MTVKPWAFLFQVMLSLWAAFSVMLPGCLGLLAFRWVLRLFGFNRRCHKPSKRPSSQANDIKTIPKGIEKTKTRGETNSTKQSTKKNDVKEHQITKKKTFPTPPSSLSFPPTLSLNLPSSNQSWQRVPVAPAEAPRRTPRTPFRFGHRRFSFGGERSQKREKKQRSDSYFFTFSYFF